MTDICHDHRACVAPTRRRAEANLFLRVAETVATWRERARQRSTLRGLQDDLLRDIGISRADAYEEGRKPFWRA